MRRDLVVRPQGVDGWRRAAATPSARRSAYLRRLIALAPDLPDLWVDIATLALRAREPDPADKGLRRALALEPGQPASYALLHAIRGLQYGDHRPHPRRTRAARQAVQAGLDDPDVRHMLGRLAYQRGAYGLAVDHFAAALRRRWSRGWAWSLSLAVLRLGRRDLIARLARTLRNRADARDLAALVLGCAAARHGRDRAALRLIDRAVAAAGPWFPEGPSALPRADEVARVVSAPAQSGVPGGLRVGRAPPTGSAAGGVVLMSSGDARYLGRFLEDLAGSARARAPGMPLHVHVVGPLNAAVATLVDRTADAWTHDSGTGILDRAYFTVSRFLFLPEIRKLWRRPVLTVDIDAVIAADPRPLLTALGPVDAACRLADHVLPWERAQVTALYTAEGDAADLVAGWYAALLRGRVAVGPVPYYADQGLLWGLMRYLQAQGEPGRFGHLELTPWLKAANQPSLEAKRRELGGGL